MKVVFCIKWCQMKKKYGIIEMYNVEGEHKEISVAKKGMEDVL